MRVYIASDNEGFELKKTIKQVDFGQFINFPVEFIDIGTHTGQKYSYVNYAIKLVKTLKKELPFRRCARQKTLGILIGATGNEMAIVANRRRKIRAVICNNEKEAIFSRENYNANILCIGAKCIDGESAVEIIAQFLSTDFIPNKYSKQIKDF